MHASTTQLQVRSGPACMFRPSLLVSCSAGGRSLPQAPLRSPQPLLHRRACSPSYSWPSSSQLRASAATEIATPPTTSGQHSASPEVVVVGGGPAGVATALMLASRGCYGRIVLLEKVGGRPIARGSWLLSSGRLVHEAPCTYSSEREGGREEVGTNGKGGCESKCERE